MIDLKVDKEESAKLCKRILEPFDNAPIEQYLTIVDAFTMALLVLTVHGKEQTYTHEDDAIEKSVLKMMKTLSESEKTNINFHKYIKL